MAMDWANLLTAGGKGAAGGLGNLFGGGRKNPSDVANQHLDNMPPFIMELMKKFGMQGDEARGPLQEQYQKMMSDPSSILSGLGKGYQESPGYQFNKNQALEAGNNAMAAGGMIGSPAHAQNAQDTASGFASRDYNDYMGNAMKVYGQGLEGMGKVDERGYEATKDFSKMIQEYFSGKANNAYEGQASKNASKNDMMKMLFDLFGKGAMAAGGI
jgi:hypothetical protein